MEENKMLYFITWESRGEGKGLTVKIKGCGSALQACSRGVFKGICFRLDTAEPVQLQSLSIC